MQQHRTARPQLKEKRASQKLRAWQNHPMNLQTNSKKQTSENSTRHYHECSEEDCTEFTYSTENMEQSIHMIHCESQLEEQHDTLPTENINTHNTCAVFSNVDALCWKRPEGFSTLCVSTPNSLLNPGFEVVYVPQMMKIWISINLLSYDELC